MATVTIKYPQIVKWIECDLVFGDTKAFFMQLIDRDAVNVAIIKVSEIIVHQMTEIFAKKKDVFSELHSLILLSCPWPGFLKRPHTITHLEDYSNNGHGDTFDTEGLFKAYLADTCSHNQQTMTDLYKAYYDDDDFVYEE
jgi:hypothetical protein